MARLSRAPHRDVSRLVNGTVAVWRIRVVARLRVLVVNRVLGGKGLCFMKAVYSPDDPQY